MAIEVFHRKGEHGEEQHGYYEVTRPRATGGRRVNVGETERWMSVAAGGALAVWALRERRGGAAMAALAGAAALLYRGTTGHCNVYQALGTSTARHGRGSWTRGDRWRTSADQYSNTRESLGGSRGIHVESAVTINKPIDELYRFWRNFENLPRFMKYLDSVAMREAGLSHWVAKGPAGTTVEWDARIINEVENKVIGWQSIEGSTISAAGSVNFDETAHGTRVHVHLQYEPPAGRLGAAVAWLFGLEPNQTVREDLRRFKQLMETGEIPTTEGQPSGRRGMPAREVRRRQVRTVGRMEGVRS